MTITNENIERLIREAVEMLGSDHIVADATDYIDTEALIDAQPMTAEEIACTYATAGFCAGIRFTLENAETTDTEAVSIKLTPTKLEQLRVIQKYNRAVFEEERPLEDIARELLYDAIRARYNRYKEKYGEIEQQEEPYTEAQREEDEQAYFEAFGLALVGDGDEVELVDLDEL